MAEVPIDPGVVIATLAATYALEYALDLSGVIPDPIQELETLFQGTPRAYDTVQIINHALGARNPALRLYGITLSRMLTDQNIILSSSDPQATAENAKAHSALIANLQAQGITNARATALANGVLQSANTPAGDYQPEFRQPLPPNSTFATDEASTQYYSDGYEAGVAKGLNGQPLLQFAEQYWWKHAPIKTLQNLRVVQIPVVGVQPAPGNQCAPGYVYDWQTQLCMPQELIPPNSLTCPQKYIFNPTTGLCDFVQPPQEPTVPINNPNPPQVPVIPVAPPQPPPNADPNGDELTDCCAATNQNLSYIANLLYQYLASNPGSANAACCASLATAISAIATAIGALPGSLGPLLAPSPAPGTPVDLTAITAAVQALQQAVQAIPAATTTAGAGISGAIGELVAAVQASQPADLTPVVAALNNIFGTLDPPQAVYNYLAAQGFITGEQAQLMAPGSLGSGLVSVILFAVKKLLNDTFNIAGLSFSAALPTFSALAAGLPGHISKALEAALSTGSEPIYPVIKALVDAVVAQLAPSGSPVLGNAQVDADLLLSKTLAPAMIINGVMLIADFLGWEIGEQLAKYLDLTTAFVGLEEVSEIKVGELMRAGPIAAAALNAKALYRQTSPGAGSAGSWLARGLITQATATQIMQFEGLADPYIAAHQLAAYHGMQPRQLIRLIESGLFTNADIQDELTFSGMRPVSQTRLLLAAPYIATQSQRNTLRSALEAAYAAGLLADTDLTSAIDSAESNTDRDSLVLTAMHWKVQVETAKELETAYTQQYLSIDQDLATYQANLEGLGLQPWKINNLIAVAETKETATLKRQATAAERKLQTQTVNSERKVLLRNFLDGNISIAAYVSGLIATGLSAVQAVAWSDLAQLQIAGSPRWTYGLQLQPAQATLLKQRVGALSQQLKDSLLTGSQFVQALQALGIGEPWVNALLASANAGIASKPLSKLTPVETS